MRWTTSQTLRVLRRNTIRNKPFTYKAARPTLSHNPVFSRSVYTRTGNALQLGMRVRRISQAALAAAVAGTAWYAYKSSAPFSRLEYSSSAGTSGRSRSPTETSPTPRKALVVEAGALYTAEIPAGQPISKQDEYGRKVIEMLDEAQVSEKLRKNEESYFVGRGKGVVRYDLAAVASNNPIEDDHVEKIIDIPASIAATDGTEQSSDWMFWGIFDGHSGWTTSALLRQTLVSHVARELNGTYQSALQSATKYPAAASIDRAIKKAFVALDDDLVHGRLQKVLASKSRAVAAEMLAPAISGACALLSFYDSRSKELRVACTGDSRAVLGRRGPNGNWTAVPLSIDQTAGAPAEMTRIKSEHPGEPDVCANGRVLGQLEPSRSFGDASYKWTRDLQEKLHRDYFARRVPRLLQTPPYVTAEPIITTTKIEPEREDFVVMATDGLFEMLTNEEVVGLVGMWLDRQERSRAGVGPSSPVDTGVSGWLPSWLGGGAPKALPVVEGTSGQEDAGQRRPVRREQWGTTQLVQSDRFVVEDSNVATHLVRNGLGGRDKNMLSALLTLTAPSSRRYRDDVTVQVIFFGQGEGERVTGRVELNDEASTGVSVQGIKPKL